MMKAMDVWIFYSTFFIFLKLINCDVLENRLKRRTQPFVDTKMLKETEKNVLDQILALGQYDSRIRPTAQNFSQDATKIDVNMMIRSIDKIDDVKMEYSLQITFRQKWMDSRLRYYDRLGRNFRDKVKYLTLTDPGRVWMPDTFFRNEREGRMHKILIPNLYVRIFPDGAVLYSIRVSLTLSCPMNLKLYPMDRQRCPMQIASYGWATDDLIYIWKNSDPVQIQSGISLPRFVIESYSSAYCNVKTNTGEYSCLQMMLVLKREFSYYMLTIYVPTCMLVIVSWFNFWIDPKAVPARTTLGVTTLLTMSTKTASINNSLPPVAYTKAVDVWTNCCIFFVFFALLEYTAVNAASRSDARRLQERSENCNKVNLQPKRRGNILINWLHRFPSRAKKIDVISRIIFPFLFSTFNIVYWAYYLHLEAESQNMTV